MPAFGVLPSSRQGHAACVVDDIMYIFGGLNHEDQLLGDLSAFKFNGKPGVSSVAFYALEAFLYPYILTSPYIALLPLALRPSLVDIPRHCRIALTQNGTCNVHGCGEDFHFGRTAGTGR